MKEKTENSTLKSEVEKSMAFLDENAVRLHSVRQRFKHSSLSSEDEVLKVSQQLRNLSTRFKENAAASSILTQKIQEGDGFDIQKIQSLHQETHQELTLFLEGIIQTSTELYQILPKIHEILSLEIFVENFAASIRMVGTLMALRISKHDLPALSPMVTSMKELADQAERNIASVSHFAEKTSVCIRKQSLSMRSWGKDVKAQLQEKKGPIQGFLLDFEQIIHRNLNHCRAIQNDSKNIIPEIHQVTSYLQYHDITCQKLEHVDACLLQLREHIPHSETQSSRQPVHPLDWIEKNFEIQIAQLNNILRETQKMFTGCSRHLLNSSKLANQQASVASLIHQEEASNQERIHALITGFNWMREILNQVHTNTQDILVSLQEITVFVEEVLQYITLVESIREDLQVIAYNSIFKSGKLKAQTSDLEVISREISRLSDKLQIIFDEEMEDVREIFLSIRSLKDKMEQDLNQQLQTTTDLARQTKISVEELQKGNQEIIESMKKISQTTKNLENKINALVEKSHMQEDVESSISKGIQDIQMIRNELIAELNQFNRERSELELSDFTQLLQLYTTEDERQILRKCFYLESLPDQEVEDPISTDQEGNDLGDNIELF